MSLCYVIVTNRGLICFTMDFHWSFGIISTIKQQIHRNLVKIIYSIENEVQIHLYDAFFGGE